MTDCLCDNVDLHDALYKSFKIRTDRTSSPWDKEILCAKTENSDKYRIMWRNLDTAFDFSPVAVAADFYLYEYVIAVTGVTRIPEHVINEFAAANVPPGSLFQLGLDALKAQRQLEESCVDAFIEYLHFALVCEMSHDSGFAITFGNENRWSSMWGWGQLVKKVGRHQAALYAAQVFGDKTRRWADCFGGYRWAKIAKVLAQIESPEAIYDKHLALDRILSLQHNTGCVFSKGTFNCFNDYATIGVHNPHHLENMSDVLFAHDRSDIHVLINHASRSAHKLLGADSAALFIERLNNASR